MCLKTISETVERCLQFLHFRQAFINGWSVETSEHLPRNCTAASLFTFFWSYFLETFFTLADDVGWKRVFTHSWCLLQWLRPPLVVFLDLLLIFFSLAALRSPLPGAGAVPSCSENCQYSLFLSELRTGLKNIMTFTKISKYRKYHKYNDIFDIFQKIKISNKS